MKENTWLLLLFLVLESVQVFPSLFANARSVEQLGRSETATSKTNILVFFLTNKKLFAEIIYIKIIIFLKVHVYGQKIKEIDFSALATKLYRILLDFS